MCCFSGKVDVVADTNIFARAAKDDRQFLVYSMSFKSAADIAMILPIPTPKASAEDAVKFRDAEWKAWRAIGAGELQRLRSRWPRG